MKPVRYVLLALAAMVACLALPSATAAPPPLVSAYVASLDRADGLTVAVVECAVPPLTDPYAPLFLQASATGPIARLTADHLYALRLAAFASRKEQSRLGARGGGTPA